MSHLPPFDRELYAFPRQAEPFPQQWDTTRVLLDGAESAGVVDAPLKVLGTPAAADGLDVLGSAPPAPSFTDLNPMRIRTIAEQLWLLGYLKQKPRRNFSATNQAKEKFQAAVATFQEEAGINVDGWSGDETWRALSALVGFESATEVDRWTLPDGSFRRAFRRAIQLRLFSYGLAKQPPGPDFMSVPAANATRAQEVLWALALIDDDQSLTPPAVWATLLFDHEGLVQAAARFDTSFDHPRFRGEQYGNVRLALRCLLVNLAKIELWLLGSEARIDGQDDYPVAGLGVARVARQRGARRVTLDATDAVLRAFMVQYWQELLDLPDGEARAAAGEITPALFKSLTEPGLYSRTVTTAFEEVDYSREVAGYFERQSSITGTLGKAYTEAKRLGMKLFDGLRRLWRWIQSGVRKVVQFARNMYRAFFRFAIKGYVIVRTAFTALARALKQYQAGRLEIPGATNATVLIAPDFDTRVILATSEGSADTVTSADAASRAIVRFGAMFQLSMRIIALFVDLLKSAFTGLLGWARLLMVLVKHYRELAPAYRELVVVL